MFKHTTCLRVRYSDTDQMGTYYNSRPLEWFECGRTELLRAAGIPYSEMEQRGVLLPIVEAHLEYRRPARYDDELKVKMRAEFCGKARLRFNVEIVHAATDATVVTGHTVHAIVDLKRKPIRPPAWLIDSLGKTE